MSNRAVHPPRELLGEGLKALSKRVGKLERGSVLKGYPAVQRLRVGDVELSVDDSAFPTLSLVARNLATGTPAVVIATLA